MTGIEPLWVLGFCTFLTAGPGMTAHLMAYWRWPPFAATAAGAAFSFLIFTTVT